MNKPKVLALLTSIAIAGCGGHLECASDDKTFEAIRETFDLNLKSPSTAVYGQPTFTTDGDLTKVTFTIDAQNGFGAMLRSRCEASVTCHNGKVVFKSGRMGDQDVLTKTDIELLRLMEDSGTSVK